MVVENTSQFGKIRPFKYWCQKVLPAVYDDSLSYYELLCKVSKYINDLIEVTNTQSDAIAELQDKLQEFMEGHFDSYIEEKIDEWFEENEPAIMQAIEQLQNNDENIYEYFSNYIKNLSWNCQFRKIIRDCYDPTKVYSVQGFTYFTKNSIEYIVQAFEFDNESVIAIYNYQTMVEIDRITGNYGHLNDISYSNNTIYALDTAGYVRTFEFDGTNITYTGIITLDDPAAGIEYAGENIWYTKQDGTSIYIFKCNSSFNVIETYIIPNIEQTYIQGLSVQGNKIAIAMTAPNSLLLYDVSIKDYYFISAPNYIGHCLIDEIEGVALLPNGDFLFNTNSIVDMQLICSIFKTNLQHNIQKEFETSITFTRYNQITVIIDEVNGSLTNPTTTGIFRLVGDALNYAKQLGNFEVRLLFKTDYSYPITANNSNILIDVLNNNDVINLNGLYLRYCNVLFGSSINRINLNPVNISMFTFDNVIYGGYVIESKFDIPLHTWANQTPESENYKKIYFLNSVVCIQDITYYNFNNCILMCGFDSGSPTSIYERTAIIKHISNE